MTSATTASDTVVAPDRADGSQLQVLDQGLRLIEERKHTPSLVGPEGEQIPIPAAAFHALRQIVDALSRGLSITLVPHGRELTTKEAADLLHVSRPFLTRSLLGKDIPFEKVGTHRRIRLEDVLAYRERRAQARRALLDEMTAAAQEVEGGYS